MELVQIFFKHFDKTLNITNTNFHAFFSSKICSLPDPGPGKKKIADPSGSTALVNPIVSCYFLNFIQGCRSRPF